MPSYELRNGLYITGRRRTYIGFCKSCNRETPHRRYTCGVCKTVSPVTPTTRSKIARRESVANDYKTIGMARTVQKIGKRISMIRNDRRKKFKETAEKFRKMFEGES